MAKTKFDIEDIVRRNDGGWAQEISSIEIDDDGTNYTLNGNRDITYSEDELIIVCRKADRKDL